MHDKATSLKLSQSASSSYMFGRASWNPEQRKGHLCVNGVQGRPRVPQCEQPLFPTRMPLNIALISLLFARFQDRLTMLQGEESNELYYDLC